MYSSSDNQTEVEPVSLVYSDTPFDFDEHFDEIASYTDELRSAALEISEEEAILIVVHELYHSL
jgi:hypothetical protein